MTHIFLSYARKDGLTHAERLETDLIGHGYRVWRDKRGIDPARDFTAEIEKAIEAATHVVVCITPDVKRDDSFVRREVQYALESKKPLYVARFDQVTLPPIHIINHTRCEFWDHWNTAFKQLCSYLATAPTSYIEPPPPPQTADPFREYVGKVYQRAVDYLDRAVIRLIELDVADTPEAVPARQPEMFDLLMTDQHTGESFHTFADAFQHFNGRMLLLGEPGAGKTITLMAATRDAAAARLSDPTAPLPIFGLLAVWDAANQTPIADWLGNYDRLLTPDLVQGVMANGGALLLLDGLDEMGSDRTMPSPLAPLPDAEDGWERGAGQDVEERYDPRKRFLTTLAAQLGQNRALVTCRITDYESIGAQAALDGAVTLQRLTDVQLCEYLKDLPALLNAVETDAGLNEIARTPLLLSFFAFAFRDRNDDLKALEDLREGALRDAIFNAYMEKRYAHEERRLRLRGLGEKMPFSLQEIRDVLGRVAMENAGGKVRREGDFFDVEDYHVDNVLEIRNFELVLSVERLAIFLNICVQLQYLLRSLDNTYGFVHLLLRDMLVYDFSMRHLRETKLYEDWYHPNPSLSLGAIRDWRAFEDLLDLAEDTQANSLLRRCAIEGIGRLGDSRSITPLIQLLGDSDIDVTFFAANALRQIGDIAIKPLILSFANSDIGVRARAAFALVNFKEAALQLLLGALNNSDANIRSNVAYTLGRLGDVRAVQPLIDHLADNVTVVHFDRVCVAAAEALESIGTPEALAAVKAWRARGGDKR